MPCFVIIVIWFLIASAIVGRVISPVPSCISIPFASGCFLFISFTTSASFLIVSSVMGFVFAFTSIMYRLSLIHI